MNLIFDLDGCLIDSSEVQRAAFFGAYKEVVGDENCPSYEEYLKHTGDSVDNVMKKLKLPKEMAKVFRTISSNSVDRIRVNWEAIELIRKLRDVGCRIAICTGKDHYRTVDILNYYNISSLFDALICADDVREPKPNPEPILKALAELGCTKDSALVIGDGYNDILSAQSAGVKSILTTWYGDVGVPRESDYICSSVDELKKVLRRLLSKT